MIPIPSGVQVSRNKLAERMLLDKSRAWLEQDNRAVGVHASDIMDPLQAFWRSIAPQPLTDREVGLFLPGKVLHAFVLGAVDDQKVIDLAVTDEGSFYSKELDIYFSPDKILNGKVRELKTSRSFYEPVDVEDIDTYVEQLLIYMAATNTLASQLWVLYLNVKDGDGNTAPAFRAFDVKVTQAELDEVKAYIKSTVNSIHQAIKTGAPDLPLCREWKCGRRRCPWYDRCKPPGRYGTTEFDKMPGPPKVRRSKKT